MELYQLRTFVAVAEEGNLTKAADRVHASQPAVSAHIKALEDELGVPLFIRTSRGMALTEAGMSLRARAETVLQATEDMLAQARNYREELTGELRIGLNTDPVFLRITEIVNFLAERHPKLRIKLDQSSSSVILRDVKERRLDAGFSFFANPYAEVSDSALREIPVKIVAPAAWADEVAGKDLRQLADMPWVRPEDDCPFLKIFEKCDLRPTQVIEVNSEEIIKQLVGAGKGLSLLREDDARLMVEAGKAVICPVESEMSLHIHFAVLKSRLTDPLVLALNEAVTMAWAGERGEGLCRM